MNYESTNPWTVRVRLYTYMNDTQRIGYWYIHSVYLLICLQRNQNNHLDVRCCPSSLNTSRTPTFGFGVYLVMCLSMQPSMWLSTTLSIVHCFVYIRELSIVLYISLLCAENVPFSVV